MLRHICNSSRGKKGRNISLFIIAPVVVILGISIFFLMVNRDTLTFIVCSSGISLAVAFFVCFLYCLYFALFSNLYVRKHYYELWKKGFSFSLEQRTRASRQISALNDPYLVRLYRNLNRVGLLMFAIWGGLFLLILAIAVVGTIFNLDLIKFS